eukprot:gene23099-24453_t
MPISSPPQNYALDPPGTSGVPVGPDVIIVDDDLKFIIPGSGYLNNNAANEESFVSVEGHGDGWFNTGDEALQQHPAVKEALAFSAPHRQFQETVG